MSSNENNSAEAAPRRRGRPKGSVKEKKSDKVMHGISLPKEQWEKIEALRPEGVPLSRMMEDIVNESLKDTLYCTPAEAGIKDADRFLTDFLQKFDLVRPFTALSSVLKAVGQLEITHDHKRLHGSHLLASDKEMEEIARFVLDHTELPVALVEQGGKFLVWWGESSSPEVLKMRLAGKLIATSGEK